MPRRGKKSKAAQQREIMKGEFDQSQSRISELRVSNSSRISHAKTVLSGTLNQGDARFLCPGIQCTYISFLSLVKMIEKEPESWTTADVDSCIIDGNCRFMKHCRMLHIEPKMLMANELPEIISFSEKSFVCKQSDRQIIVGLLKPNTDANYVSKTLCDGLSEVFSTADSCLLICGGLTVGLSKHSDSFFAFDPHSRGKDGLVSPTGTAVLIVFPNLNQMIAHFERLFLESLKLRCYEQFELVPLTISRQMLENIDTLGNSNSTSTNEESKKEKKVDHVKNTTDASKQQDTSDKNERSNLALPSNAIKSYFEDQKNREKLFQKGKSLNDLKNSLDRKQYMQRYMRKKRESETFKRNENKAAKLRMQQNRSTSEGHEINKKRSAEGMKKLLKDSDARNKHNQMSSETMRKRLCTSEERIKHNEKSAKSMKKMMANDEKRQKHKERTAEGMRKMLTDEKKRQKHNETSADGMRKLLTDEKRRQKHKEKAIECMRNRLKDEQTKQNTRNSLYDQ